LPGFCLSLAPRFALTASASTHRRLTRFKEILHAWGILPRHPPKKRRMSLKRVNKQLRPVRFGRQNRADVAAPAPGHPPASLPPVLSRFKEILRVRDETSGRTRIGRKISLKRDKKRAQPGVG